MESKHRPGMKNYECAMSAAQDAANRQMKRENRLAWSYKDWDLACEEFIRLHGVYVKDVEVGLLKVKN